MSNFIKGRVIEAKRDTYAHTSGSISTTHTTVSTLSGDFKMPNVSGGIQTQLVTQTIFKLENDNRTFLLKAEQLVETGDEVGLYASHGASGFFRVLALRNYTKCYWVDCARLTERAKISSLLLSVFIVIPLVWFVSILCINALLGHIIPKDSVENETLKSFISAVVHIVFYGSLVVAEFFAIKKGLKKIKARNEFAREVKKKLTS